MHRSTRHWKACAIVALSALIFFQAAGWFLVCGIRQFHAKQAAGAALGLPETPLLTVTLPVSLVLHHRIGKKELRLDGRLFDIKDQRISGDSVTLTLYHDRHEEKVLNALGSLLNPDNRSADASVPPLQYWLSKWLGTPFLLPVAPEVHPPAVRIFYTLFHCLLPAAQAGPGSFSPPPEG